MTSPTTWRTLSEVLDTELTRLHSTDRPIRYRAGDGELKKLRIEPGRIMLIGGPPNCGKTSFAMQLTIDALRATPALRGIVCNVEMDSGLLVDRQISRLSGVPLSLITDRQLDWTDADITDRIERGCATLAAIDDRLWFTGTPHTMANVLHVAGKADAGLILIDYIQRIHTADDAENDRTRINCVMGYLREMAAAGAAVIIISALSRSKDNKGRPSYASEGMSLSSFRDTSELEYGADDAYLLQSVVDDSANSSVVLRHVKARYGALQNLSLLFDRSIQCFTSSVGNEFPSPLPATKCSRSNEENNIMDRIEQAWAETPAATPRKGSRKHNKPDQDLT